jgi:hypothetical protein
MLSKCLNPQCTARFRYLWEGRLFRVDLSEVRRRKSAPTGRTPLACINRHLRPVEHFWLCASCAARMTVEASESQVRLVALAEGARKPVVVEPAVCPWVARAS